MSVKLDTTPAPGLAAPLLPPAHVQRLQIFGALMSVYFIWGSTYLGMAIAIETMPPFLMSALRFALSGSLLLGFLLLRGAKLPSRAQTRNALLVGAIMIGGGTGAVAFAEQWVDTGLTALMVAAVPLWAALFGGLWGRWPRRLEWIGIVVGLGGVALLNLEGGMRANPLGALVLIFGPMCWAFGSMWSRQISMPTGLLSAAVQMFGGTAALLALSLLTQEQMAAVPSTRSLLAFAYLAFIGSLIGFTTYLYLLKTVRPALATSYAYVNPVVAVLLGVTLAGETISPLGMTAMFIILGGVALIAIRPGADKTPAPAAQPQPAD